MLVGCAVGAPAPGSPSGTTGTTGTTGGVDRCSDARLEVGSWDQERSWTQQSKLIAMLEGIRSANKTFLMRPKRESDCQAAPGKRATGGSVLLHQCTKEFAVTPLLKLTPDC